ncbi:50S ribosomal protein L11 methyltransferase, partial [Bacteroidota bacterium]
MEKYIKLICEFNSDDPELSADILIGELSEFKFESFEKNKTSLSGYIKETDYSQAIESKLINLDYAIFSNLKIDTEIIHQKNWNKIWESNFNPILINEKCIIKAPFHKNTPETDYEIIIEPKMSFGTGHHETTSLMIREMLKINFTNKAVIDVGCGTGILSIMASKLNAKTIYAIDIDEWAYKNTHENCKLNNVENIEIIYGDIKEIQNQIFDIILANINLNVIFNSLTYYAKILVSEGWLLL